MSTGVHHNHSHHVCKSTHHHIISSTSKSSKICIYIVCTEITTSHRSNVYRTLWRKQGVKKKKNLPREMQPTQLLRRTVPEGFVTEGWGFTEEK